MKSFQRLAKEHKPEIRFWPPWLVVVVWIVNLFTLRKVYTRGGAALFDIALEKLGDKRAAAVVELTADLLEFGSTKRPGEKILKQVARRRRMDAESLRSEYKLSLRGGENKELNALVKRVRTGYAR